MKALFERVLHGPWITSGRDVQYRIEAEEGKAFLFFQCSRSKSDWKYNFMFPPVLYKEMKKPFRVHAGFALLWHSVRDEIMDKLKAAQIQHLTIVGYSQGAALATLAHEDCGFQIPNVEVNTVAFASPRLLWMPPYKGIVERFREVRRWSVRGDIVTMVPPALMGYRHIGVDNKVGPITLPSTRNHYPERYEEWLP